MKIKSSQFTHILWITLAFAWLLAACKAAPQRESKPSADWSRSVSVGNFVNGSIGIAVNGAGERVHLVWPANVGEGTYLRYVQLDTQAQPVIEKNLEFPGILRAPRLAAAGENELHLFWGSRPPGGKMWAIWYARLGTGGEFSNAPVQISQPEVGVGNYLVASDHQGGVVLCWERDTSGEIYLQHLDQNGSPLDGPVMLTSTGSSPAVWVNSDDNVYLAWQQEGSVVFARAALQDLSAGDVTAIGDIPQGTGLSFDGPYLGVAGDWAYVFWSVLNQSGLEAGTGYTAYTAFPVDAPANLKANRLLLSPDEEQPYTAYEGSFHLTQLAPPAEAAWASTDFILSPSVMQGSQTGELAMAVAMNQAMRLDQHLQIAIGVFKDGQFVGYTLGTKTENISDDPVLFIDTLMNLHLAWREGAAGNSVFYATTQAQASAALERLTAGDIINAIFQGGMEGLVGVAFLPVIGFGWLLPGMVVVGIVKFFRDQDNLVAWYHWIPLIFALLLYHVVKLATLPTIASYVPFSAWVDIPARVGEPLRVIVPLLIFVIAFLVANRILQKKTQSAAVFYISFTLVDALLTLAIYGVNFLGVY